MALIPGRCRRTCGTAKSRTPRVIRRWRRIGSTGSGRTRLAAAFAVGRFAAFTATCSQWSARSIQRALRCSSSARSASRRQASAFRRNCAGQQKSGAAPRLLAAPRRWQSGLHSIHGRAQHLPPANRCRYSRRWRSLTQHLQRRPGFPFPQVRPTAAGAPRHESRPY